MIPEFDACTDIPDERNYKYQEVVGATGELPSEHFIDDGEFQNQATAGFPYGCVFFSQSMGENELNFVE